MYLRLCAALAVLVMSAPALSEDCSQISDRDARLACFDRGAGGAAPAAAPADQRKQATSARCQGITKKGAQCKRNAQPGRSYCYQH